MALYKNILALYKNILALYTSVLVPIEIDGLYREDHIALRLRTYCFLDCFLDWFLDKNILTG
jgi:hypothetical protein